MANRSKKEQFAVIGLGRFGSAMAKSLAGMGKDVLAIDARESNINNIREYVTHSIIAEATEANVLKELGINNFDAVIIAIGENIQASILVAMMCKELGVKRIIAKAHNSTHKKVLEKIGVDLVIIPEEEMAVKLASCLNHPNMSDLMGLTDDYSIVETGIPKNWRGKNLAQLNIRDKYLINLLMIKRGNEVIAPPTGETILMEGDKLIAGGFNFNLYKFTDKIAVMIDNQ